MQLSHRFNDYQVNSALELFLKLTIDHFGQRLISVILFGSIVFDDLSPGYGDLDFLVVVKDDLSDEDCAQLIELRKPLKNGTYGIIMKMLEGAFLPKNMLDPDICGHAFGWGTSGERVWSSNKLGWLVLHLIREKSILIWGEDIRVDIKKVNREQLLQETWDFCSSMEEHGKGGTLHSIDWLLTAARSLLFLKEGKFSSKSEAADWAHCHAEGDWREWLPKAKQIRLNPALDSSDDVQQWLTELKGPIQAACGEIKREIYRQDFVPSSRNH